MFASMRLVAAMVAAGLFLGGCASNVSNRFVPQSGGMATATCIAPPLLSKKKAALDCATPLPDPDLAEFNVSSTAPNSDAWASDYVLENMDVLSAMGGGGGGQSFFVPTSCQDVYFGPDWQQKLVTPQDDYLGTICDGFTTTIGNGNGGVPIAYVPKGSPCGGGGMASGDSVDGSYSDKSTITDVAPVDLSVGIAGGSQTANQLIGWIYTTSGGQYFQAAGTFSLSASGTLQFFAGIGVGVGGGLSQSPVVPFSGSIIGALNQTLSVLGFANKALPPPLNALAAGTATIHSHSCYHK